MNIYLRALVVGLLCCGISVQAQSAPALYGAFELGTAQPQDWQTSPGAACQWLSENARHGKRAVQAETSTARPTWASRQISLDGAIPQLVEGWIRRETGAAWLEVRRFDGQGRLLDRFEGPKVRSGHHWTYTAIEIPPFEPGKDAAGCSVQIAFWVRGRASLDDVSVHNTASLGIMNSRFELPLDKKGRVSFWNAEEDRTLLPGPCAGSIGLVKDLPGEGQTSLEVKATERWFAVSSIPYPAYDWTQSAVVQAKISTSAAAEVRLGVLWTDAAQKTLRTDFGDAVEASEWRTISAGPFPAPEGARQARPILAVQAKTESSGQEVLARFDEVALDYQDRPVVRPVVNQAGYEVNAPKTAIVLANFQPKYSDKADFALVDDNGRAVCRGPLQSLGRMRGAQDADWGWYFYKAEFSSVIQPGQYRIRAKAGKIQADSSPFPIARDVLFQTTLPANTDFFFVQRCGFEVPGWHAPCHLDDAKLPDGTHRDLTGGWHSAGDYNKLNYEYGDGGALYALINAYETQPAFFTSFDRDKDGLCDILDEAWWGAKFLAKVQIPETGGVLNHIEQGPTRKIWMNWCPPEKTTDNVVGTEDDPIVTKGPGNSPLAIGGWARLAPWLKQRGIENDYLERAIRLWENATANGTAAGSPLLLISSIDLYHAVKDERFLSYAQRSVDELLASGAASGQLPGGNGDSGDLPAAALAYFALRLTPDSRVPAIRERLKQHTPGFLAEANNPLGLMRQKNGPEGYFFEPTSTLGCNYMIACRAWSALLVYQVNHDAKLLEYALNQLDFILGKNTYDLCMMEGIGTSNLPRYHHRYGTIPGHETGAVRGAVPNGFVRDIAANDRPGADLSTGGRPYPSYRTNEPWLIHNVFEALAVTALHDALAD